MLSISQRLLKQTQPFEDLVCGVDVDRRTVALGQRFQRDYVAVQRAAPMRMMEGTRR